MSAIGMVEFDPAINPEKFEVLGSDMQIINVALDPGEKLTGEPGSMTFMQPSIKNSVDCNNCFGRCCSGEPCVMANFTNEGEGKAILGITPNFPAKIIPIDLGAAGNKFRAKNGAFFASIGPVEVSINFDCNPKTCCFGGQGCARQTVGGEGTAFLAAMGTIMTKDLAEGETIVVDTNSTVAWEETVKLDIRLAGGCCTCCCGGEGMFNTTLTGPGKVVFQSMSIEKFKAALRVAAQQQAGGSGGGEGGEGAPDNSEMSR